ncbi:MAG: HAMP domain-containing protein [Candidatus Portnoybacteria bacterium]|nr:HAMP domain-containing protein [Candidatus Portnoybacteria bacterium]
MKIRTRLYFSSIITIVLVGLFFATQFYTNNKIETANKKHNLAYKIESTVFHLNMLTHEYLIYREERILEQWNSRYNSLAPILAAAGGGKEEELIISINQDYLVFNGLFSQVTANYAKRQKLLQEGASQEEINTLSVLEEGLAAQLLLKSQKIFSDTLKLTENLDTEIIDANNLATKLRIIFLLILGLFSITTTFIVSGVIVKSLDKLRKSAEIISKGNLEHKIDIKGKDEIGQVSRAFNEMTDKLKEFYTGLEEKIKERTEELSEERARLMASIRSLSFGFILCDLDDQILIKNPAVSRILGIQDGEITIDKIREYFKGAANLEIYHNQCLKEKRPVEIKNIGVGKKFFRLLLAPVIMLRDSEEVIGHILLIEDITEVKLLERAREEFFSIASHELRTPLTAIRGNTSLIQEFYTDKIKDKDVAQMISDMHEASVRLIGIVNDFLDVSRLEQKKTELKKEKFDMAALIEETINEVKGVASQKNLYLKFEPPLQSFFSVMADRGRTKQIIMNLLGNAINYTPKGGATIKIEPQGKYLKTYVTDTGVGISSENQTLLFRKFQQAGEKILTRNVTQGVGFGLYISKLLVESMGGTIELFKSELGVGSTFAFTLLVAS